MHTVGEGESDIVFEKLTKYECVIKCKALASSDPSTNGVSMVEANETCICTKGMSKQLNSVDHSSCYLPGKPMKHAFVLKE